MLHLNAISSSLNEYDLLLAEFPDITTPTFNQSSMKHGVEHFITTRGPSIHSGAHRLSPEKLSIAKAEFKSVITRLMSYYDQQANYALTWSSTRSQ